MVPFFGQGLNCGLEDVRVLYYLLKNHAVDPLYSPPEGGDDKSLVSALNAYTETRHEDLITIIDLAMDN